MAEVKLSTVWEVNNYRNIASSNMLLESGELTALRHPTLPGLTWEARLFGEDRGPKGFIDYDVVCNFDKNDMKSVWANVKATLLDVNGDSVASCEVDLVELTSHGRWMPGWRVVESDYAGGFRKEDVNKAVNKASGSLRIRIDLKILNIRECLKCRGLLRGLLTSETLADFDVKVVEQSFKLHKCILAESSKVFAAMFESGMKETAEGMPPLVDTTPAAFKAFIEAIYYDNWDFLSVIDLTHEVLYLAEKYDVADLKRYCDESLAAKVDHANALEILTKSAALCTAEKTTAACIAILAEHPEFKKAQIWLDFKKDEPRAALDISDAVSEKLVAANAQLKRKCSEMEKASRNKRRRK